MNSPKRIRFKARLVRFFRDCGEVTAAAELYVYRALVAGYGLWHIFRRLK